MTTIQTLARMLSLALISMLMIATADARSRHRPSTNAELLAQLAALRQEIALFRKELRTDHVAVKPAEGSSVVASLGDPAELEATLKPKQLDRLLPVHVFPANGTQRGQWNDRRKTHRHAGIDIGGVWGSEIVASFAGVVLPAPGRDRGYGPNVIVVRGDDGLVYRYAHLARVAVRTGQHVNAGQRIGLMGKVGRNGFPHLHFEMMRLADYRRRPYGVHGLDPNDYLGGGRGKRMAAGEPMQGHSAVKYASAAAR